MSIHRRCGVPVMIVCAALAGMLSPSLDAQVSECAKMVGAIYNHMAGEQRSSGAISRLRYTVRTTSRWQGKTQTTVSNVEMISSDARLYLDSEQMEVGQDATTAVVVMPGRRQILISGSNLEAFRQLRGSSMAGLRDSVINSSDVTECSARTDGVAGSDRKAVFRLKPGPRQRLKMESVTIYMNATSKTIQKIIFTPTTENTVTALEVTFDAIDFTYTTDRFSRPLLSQFIDAKGQPLPKYKGYTVSDARKNSR